MANLDATITTGDKQDANKIGTICMALGKMKAMLDKLLHEMAKPIK